MPRRAKKRTPHAAASRRRWAPHCTHNLCQPHSANHPTHHHGGARHLGGEFGFEGVDGESHWEEMRWEGTTLK